MHDSESDEMSEESQKEFCQSTNSKYCMGRWAIEETHSFKKALMIYGRDWKKVQELVPTRTPSQIRSHAQKYFIKESAEPIPNFDKKSKTASINNYVKESIETYLYKMKSDLMIITRSFCAFASKFNEIIDSFILEVESYRKKISYPVQEYYKGQFKEILEKAKALKRWHLESFLNTDSANSFKYLNSLLHSSGIKKMSEVDFMKVFKKTSPRNYVDLGRPNPNSAFKLCK